jgi:hypothetical protein
LETKANLCEIGGENVVFVFEFFETLSDGQRVLIEIQKHRAKSAELAKLRARTIIKSVVRQGRSADVCLIKDQMGGLIGELAVGCVGQSLDVAGTDKPR